MSNCCKDCANSEKVCGATMIVICNLTGFPKRYDNDAEHCIGFEPKEENKHEGSESADTE